MLWVPIYSSLLAGAVRVPDQSAIMSLSTDESQILGGLALAMVNIGGKENDAELC